tara:strand:+ start:497 stop:2797 length:2301 start_codon:yes stop_codon:yes gene_type:complete
MSTRNTAKNLQNTKQAIIKRFKHPPGPGIGKDGDLGIAMVPRKGLHFFHKYGGQWYGIRMDRVINTEQDDRRVVIPGGETKENGELAYNGGKVQIQTSDATRKELYRAGGTNVAIADGGTNADTADGALDNLGGTTVGKNLFKATNEANARSAISVDAAGTDNSTPVTIASGKDYISLSGQELTLGNIDLTSDVTGTLPVGNTEAKCTDANADQTSANNAASATVLETARDIGGVSFNGSASINLPGVNTAGNQNTSGNADTATLAAKATGINTTSNGFVKTGSGDGTISVSANVDMANDVTGTLPVGNGGTGLTDISTLLNSNTTKNDVGLSAVLNRAQIQTFEQAGVPTSTAAGDLWIDTDDDNKLYIAAAAGSDEIKAGEWVLYKTYAAKTEALASAVNIGGVSFDGSSNIDLPGVNTAGNQNTSGIAAKATNINTSDNGFVKTGSSNGTVSISSQVDLTSDVTGTLPTSNTAAKVTEVDGNTGAVTAAEIKATALTDATAGTLTASKAIVVDSNSRIDTLKAEGVTVGTGSGHAVITSEGDYNISLKTGNSDTGTISIIDGADEAINLAPNGTGVIRVGGGSNAGHITTKNAQDLKLSTNDDTNSGTITITDGATGDITIAPQRNTVTASPIGFTHVTTDGGSTGNVTDVPINFATSGNKYRLTFTGGTQTFTNVQLVFPSGISGNFTLIVKTHSSVSTNAITNYLAYVGDTSTAATVNAVIWPGGSKPTITNTADRTDIISFYWDSDAQAAYGVITQDFSV